MSISLTPDQERFIQTKLQDGKYHSAEEVLEVALRLLDEYDRADAEWVEDVREKIDAALAKRLPLGASQLQSIPHPLTVRLS